MDHCRSSRSPRVSRGAAGVASIAVEGLPVEQEPPSTTTKLMAHSCDVGGDRCAVGPATIRGESTAQACWTGWNRYQEEPIAQLRTC